jgi:hypothetical protein
MLFWLIIFVVINIVLCRRTIINLHITEYEQIRGAQNFLGPRGVKYLNTGLPTGLLEILMSVSWRQSLLTSEWKSTQLSTSETMLSACSKHTSVRKTSLRNSRTWTVPLLGSLMIKRDRNEGGEGLNYGTSELPMFSPHSSFSSLRSWLPKEMRCFCKEKMNRTCRVHLESVLNDQRKKST